MTIVAFVLSLVNLQKQRVQCRRSEYVWIIGLDT